MGDCFMDALNHFLLVQSRDVAVQRRCPDKGVNAGLFSVLHCLPTAIYVFEIGARQPANHRIHRVLRDFGYGREIPFGGNRKAGFDDIYTHFVQQACDFQLFIMGHGRARGLLAVAQCRVKDQNVIWV